MTTYHGHRYHVDDDAITPTGKRETWMAASRDDAIAMALYTHKLHNGRAWVTPRGVIHCPTCGQIAIVQSKDGAS